VRVATKLSEWPLRAEHCRPLFIRKFNATIDAEDEELVHSLGPWHVGKRIKIGALSSPPKKEGRWRSSERSLVPPRHHPGRAPHLSGP
jgi:hypothetical protein